MAQQPLTSAQRLFFIAALIVGPIVAILGIVYGDNLPSFLTGAVIGGGSGLTVLGFIMLFWRPDYGGKSGA